MSPVGRRANRAASRIFLSLSAYEQATKRGEAYTDQVAFVAKLPNRGTFSPDASYYDGPPPSDPDGFLPGPPGFAAEVRSKQDHGRAAERRLARKRKDYFAAGTKVVWDVDPAHETIAVYRATAPDRPTVYKVGQIADAEPAVPGWRMAVREVFG
jgi:Uma2 family endonuclease